MQPTHTEVQQSDPILSNLMLSYLNDADGFIASRVFPEVKIDKQTGIYYTFSKKYWFSDEVKLRAPGGEFARSGYGIETASVLAQLWGLEHPIADEARNNSQLPLSLEQAGIEWLGQQSLIRKERAWATDFMVNSVWGTTDNNSTTDWDDSAGDPVNDVLTAKRTIKNSTGRAANMLIVGGIVHQGLMNHPDIIDRMKFVQMASPGNVENALAAMFGVANYIVGDAVYNSANEGQTFSSAPVLDDDALLLHTSPNPGVMSASAGYTFSWDGGGGMGQIATYRDQSVKSDVLQLSESWDQKAVATDLGYLWLDVV